MSSSTVANNSRSSRSPAPHVSIFLGKSGSDGLDVLDTLGSYPKPSIRNRSVKAPHARTFFSKAGLGVLGSWLSNSASTNNEVSVLAFEVANTIVKGSNLMQSLSDENIQILKDEILLSKGVRLLVSTDINELLRIAVADKREELGIFSREVVRFGDMSIDPQWHNLDRFFHRLDLDTITNRQQRKEAEMTMQELFNLAQRTIELYHECHVLDGLEQIFRPNLEKGESLMILQSELKHQTKLVKNLKKKSLWSKSLEEVVEKLVDVVTFIHQTIAEAFGENDAISPNADIETNCKIERLGAAALSLHYANLITQIDSIVS
ncbi:protein PSK SIMULATOR 1-like [Bidens hawaiensis]|uniref:protein PSK SIMULATOR 1-like n=1 Tax=Bidens hawaiensis TaxID=980011 RepID=UPI00404B0E53